MEMMEDLCILDEIEAFNNRHIHLPTVHNARVMALIAGASYMTPRCPATFRALFAGPPESGKTTAMGVTVSMCSNAIDLSGTQDAARSALIGAAGMPELGPPTYYLDDLTLFGESGMNIPKDVRVDVLKRGYKRGEKLSVSRQGVNKKFSIFAPFLMSGLEVAVPKDIRSRSIVLWHEAGQAEQYFDVRYAQPMAVEYGKALKEAVNNVIDDIEAFRGYGYHPKLTQRYLEIWEPLLAVAKHVGGQRWVNYCIEAFVALTGNGSNSRQLTPRQRVIRDAVTIMDGPLAWAAEVGLIPGELLGKEFERLPGNEYAGMNENALLQHIAGNMFGVRKRRASGLSRLGYPSNQMVGYLAVDIRDQWELIRPDDPADVLEPEQKSPFDIDADDAEDFELDIESLAGVAGVAGVSQHDLSKDEPVMSLVTPPCEEDTETPSHKHSRGKLPAVERKFLKENALA